MRVYRDATPWDIRSVAGVLAATVLPTMLGRWLEAEPVARGRNLFHHGVAQALDAMRCGVARVVESGDQVIAAALWLPCGTGEPARPVEGEGDAFAARVGRLVAAFSQLHGSQPHLRLAGLGVLPRWQRAGIASVLLTEKLGAGQTPTRCLLAASDAVTAVALRCGYRQLGDPIALGPGIVGVQPMLREAESSAGRRPVNTNPGRNGAYRAGGEQHDARISAGLLVDATAPSERPGRTGRERRSGR
jgi:GNAT superfamily N-acetyltransferase